MFLVGFQVMLHTNYLRLFNSVLIYSVSRFSSTHSFLLSKKSWSGRFVKFTLLTLTCFQHVSQPGVSSSRAASGGIRWWSVMSHESDLEVSGRFINSNFNNLLGPNQNPNERNFIFHRVGICNHCWNWLDHWLVIDMSN